MLAARRHHLRPVAFVSAIFSLVQAVVWFVLSMVIIIVYDCNVTSEQVAPYTFKDFAVAYFQGDQCRYSNHHVKEIIDGCVPNLTSPSSLVAWASVILVVNILLFASSVALISVMVVFRKKLFILFLFIYLFFNAFDIILDLGMTSVLASDVAVFANAHKCSNGDVDPTTGALILLALDIIASKGVILWVGNVCFTLYLLIEATRASGCSCMWDISFDERYHDEVNHKYSSSQIKNIRDKEELNQPTQIIRRERQLVPEYSAKARWPSLVFNSEAAPYTRTLENPRNAAAPRQVQPVQHSAPVSRIDSPTDMQNPPAFTKHPDFKEHKSLQDAIRTMRPLRPVKNSPYRY